MDKWMYLMLVLYLYVYYVRTIKAVESGVTNSLESSLFGRAIVPSRLQKDLA